MIRFFEHTKIVRITLFPSTRFNGRVALWVDFAYRHAEIVIGSKRKPKVPGVRLDV